MAKASVISRRSGIANGARPAVKRAFCIIIITKFMIARARLANIFRVGRGAAREAFDNWVSRMGGHEVMLGDVPKLCGGMCRHRALLFKVLADEAGLSTSLVRGMMKTSSGRMGGHAWNEVRLSDGRRVLVDVMNPTVDPNTRRFAFPGLDEGSVRQRYYDNQHQPLYDSGSTMSFDRSVLELPASLRG